VNLVLYDLKHTDSSLHRQHTGAPIERIIRNLHRLAKLEVPVEVRIPVLPTVNDAPAVADGFAALLAPLGNVTAVRLLAYHRLAGSKYARLGRPNSMPEVPAPTREQLARVAERIARTGLNVVIPSEGR
jgi:pyruvate formate lyase activating enzyme